MKITVNVTSQHIDDGDVGRPSFCPIALALIDAGCTDSNVGYINADFTYAGSEYLNIPLPALVSKFIRSFDGADFVKPFSFEWDIEEHIR